MLLTLVSAGAGRAADAEKDADDGWGPQRQVFADAPTGHLYNRLQPRFRRLCDDFRLCYPKVPVEGLPEVLLEAFRVVAADTQQGRPALNQIAGMSDTEFAEKLLQRQEFRTAMRKHLSEKQLQDYLTSRRARGRQLRWAIDRFLIAWIDERIGLSAEQRAEFEKIMDRTQGLNNGTRVDTAMNATPNFAHLRLKANMEQVEAILSDGQLQYWKMRLDQHYKRTFKNREEEAEYNRQRPLLLIKAQLVAYTAQLGPLDERAARRLDIATKGVLEDQVEAYHFYQKVLRTGRHDATQWLADNRDRAYQAHLYNVVNHPLYQQTIESVLPQAALAAYKKKRATRTAYREQVVRNLLTASLDALLLLDDQQRRTAREIVEQTPVPSGISFSVVDMVGRLGAKMGSQGVSEAQVRRFRQNLGRHHWD